MTVDPGEMVPQLPTVELRMSPAGVIAKRDLRREPGWPTPHWTVLDMPAGDLSHWVGQRLVDAAVAGWSVLVRREQAGMTRDPSTPPSDDEDATMRRLARQGQAGGTCACGDPSRPGNHRYPWEGSRRGCILQGDES